MKSSPPAEMGVSKGILLTVQDDSRFVAAGSRDRRNGTSIFEQKAVCHA
jgi:hypothetical protein